MDMLPFMENTLINAVTLYYNENGYHDFKAEITVPWGDTQIKINNHTSPQRHVVIFIVNIIESSIHNPTNIWMNSSLCW